MFQVTSKSMSSVASSSSNKEELYQEIIIDPSCKSLLSLLDDKNRAIATLQKQLDNQKAQLTYYLQKELESPKITQLSESCCPEIYQENIAINLAMSKFNRQVGIKSDILGLYERMCFIDEKVTQSLEDQEFLLRKIVNKLCEFVKHSNKIEFRVQFRNFISDPFQIELFNKLLGATAHLRKGLDTFRICCNRLMIIEDERNLIVEQIYTLPAEQRMNCNLLITMQTEKIQLENELQQILKDQRKDQERIKELGEIEQKLSYLQQQLQSSIFNNVESCRINKMLQKVHAEAKLLLDLTTGQRKKYENEILRVRRQKNLTLERALIYIKMAMENKEIEQGDTEDSISSKEEIKIYECIKKEIDHSKDKFKGKIFDDLHAKRRECEFLKNRLNQVLLERNELKFENAQLHGGISDIKFHHNLELSSLKDERDTYKSQVEDLEAIREAYAQLVERHPTTSKMEKEFCQKIRERDKKINELEKFSSSLRKEVRSLKNLINKQNKELRKHHEFLGSLKEHSNSTKEFGDNSSKIIKYVYKNRNAMEDFNKFNSDNSENCIGQISYIELYEQEILVGEQTVSWIGKDRGARSFSVTGKMQFADDHTKVNDNQVKIVAGDSLNLEKQEEKDPASLITFAQFKVSSNDIKKEQSEDIMEDIVETNINTDFEANREIQHSLQFCVDSNCEEKVKSIQEIYKESDISCQERYPDSDVSYKEIHEESNITCQEMDKKNNIADDYELMKDCSDESIAVICESVRKSKEICFLVDSPPSSCILQKKAVKINSKEGCLKNINDFTSSSGEIESNSKYKLKGFK